MPHIRQTGPGCRTHSPPTVKAAAGAAPMRSALPAHCSTAALQQAPSAARAPTRPPTMEAAACNLVPTWLLGEVITISTERAGARGGGEVGRVPDHLHMPPQPPREWTRACQGGKGMHTHTLSLT